MPFRLVKAAAVAIAFAVLFTPMANADSPTVASSAYEVRQNALAQFNRATALISDGKRAEASAILLNVIAVFPTWNLARLEYAANELEMDGDAEKPLQTITALAVEGFTTPRSLYYQGMGYERTGNVQSAEKLYYASITAKPDYFEPRFALARLLKKLGRLDDAQGQLESAVAIDQNLFSARFLLIDVCESSGKLTVAEMHLKIIIGMRPANLYDRYRLAKFYERNGMLDKAREQYEIADRMSPSKTGRATRSLPPSKR